MLEEKRAKLGHVTPLAKHFKAEIVQHAALKNICAKPKYWLSTKLVSWLKENKLSGSEEMWVLLKLGNVVTKLANSREWKQDKGKIPKVDLYKIRAHEAMF
eukprot:14411019-Ditylum_brightwellii.AAC.1